MSDPEQIRNFFEAGLETGIISTSLLQWDIWTKVPGTVALMREESTGEYLDRYIQAIQTPLNNLPPHINLMRQIDESRVLKLRQWENPRFSPRVIGSFESGSLAGTEEIEVELDRSGFMLAATLFEYESDKKYPHIEHFINFRDGIILSTLHKGPDNLDELLNEEQQSQLLQTGKVELTLEQLALSNDVSIPYEQLTLEELIELAQKIRGKILPIFDVENSTEI
jgi:hypothetical protein